MSTKPASFDSYLLLHHRPLDDYGPFEIYVTVIHSPGSLFFPLCSLLIYNFKRSRTACKSSFALKDARNLFLVGPSEKKTKFGKIITSPNMKLFCLLVLLIVVALLDGIGANGNKKLPGTKDPWKRVKTVNVAERKEEKQKLYLNTSEANKQISDLINKRNKTSVLKPKPKLNKTLKNKKLCHATATLRCGCEALRNFELGNETKCAIREKFFRCLDDSIKPPCRHPKKSIQKIYRKNIAEIVRVLWTTRVCLLATDDVSQNTSLSKLKIKSNFCSKIIGRTGPKRNQGNKKKPKRKNKS